MSSQIFRFFCACQLVIGLCLIPSLSGAASSSADAPAAIAGQRVDAGDFSLTLPAGWIMPYPLNHKPDGVSGVFSHEKTEVTVTVNVIHIRLKAREFMDRILPQMEKSHFTLSKPVSRNGFLVVDMKSAQAHGQAWFASNGKVCVAVVILTPKADLSAANQLLGALKGSIPLPAKVE